VGATREAPVRTEPHPTGASPTLILLHINPYLHQSARGNLDSGTHNDFDPSTVPPGQEFSASLSRYFVPGYYQLSLRDKSHSPIQGLCIELALMRGAAPKGQRFGADSGGPSGPVSFRANVGGEFPRVNPGKPWAKLSWGPLIGNAKLQNSAGNETKDH
jgi:hypothetical protein